MTIVHDILAILKLKAIVLELHNILGKCLSAACPFKQSMTCNSGF